jgi:chemosensory pili system protein ChpA (sensor histidine kinase/response regulator)
MDNQISFDPAALSAMQLGLAVRLPAEVLEIEQPGDAPARLKAARSQYERGLLQWLRQEEESALELMQQAVAETLHCLPRNEHRAFWWVAHGLLDCLGLHGLPHDPDTRRLLGRIDQQLRNVAEGHDGETQAVMNEMLYLIGRSHAVSDRAAEIKRVYRLELTKQPAKEVAQALDGMLAQLRRAEESWERFIQGDAAAAAEFSACAGQLASQADRLAPGTLQDLVQQIHSCAQQLGEPDSAQPLAMDMAMALLLLGRGIAHYLHLDRGFHEQAHILSARMQAGPGGQPEGAQQLAELARLHCRMEQVDAVVPLAKEMMANLRRVRQGLSDLPGGAGSSGLQRLLGQIHGGLRILSLDEAAQLSLAIRNALGAEDAAIRQALSAGMSALEDGLQRLASGQLPDSAALLAALTGLSGLPRAPEAAAPKIAVAPRPAGEEQELLEVFLEEAREVLDSMRDNIEVCQAQPGSREPLAIIRRGFHTLKGSGRMVGLNELGEVAWCVERALNKWLQDDKPATQELLDFIGAAAQSFAGWVAELERRGEARIEAERLTVLAAQIEQGIAPESADQPLAAQPTSAAETPAAVPPVAASAQPFGGDIAHPTMLFEVASEEALHYARALRQHFAAFKASHVMPTQFIYAAHALAEANRPLRVQPVVELSAALEDWLRARKDTTFEPDAARFELLEQVVAALEGMAQSVSEQRMPQAQPGLVRQLQAAPADPQSTEGESPVESQVRDDVDAQLLPVFLEEADDLGRKIDAVLRAWRESPDDERHAQSLKRFLHTLKGSARMAGAMRIGEIVHAMEDHAEGDAQARTQASFWDALNTDFGRIASLLEELRAIGAAVTGRRAGDRASDFGEELSGNLLRVHAEVVDRLVNEAGEIGAARSSMEAELHALKEELRELGGITERLRRQMREVEIQAESRMQAHAPSGSDGAGHFDPLELDRFTRLQELTRFMDESMHDVQTVQQSLQKDIDETVTAMSVQAHAGRELQQTLMSVRTVPLASIGERLYRIVRQTAKELNKRANLELPGAGVEVDRGILERMTAPIEHLLRNAIVHGLESEPVRIRHGKSPIGEIRLGLRHENNEVVFEFSDDGAGLNFAALREKALERGLLRQNEAANDDRLAQLIFVPGFSTATEVSEIAGRGVGLDVVRTEVDALGGRIDVSSKSGEGTRFTIHLPLALGVAQMLTVRSGEAIYAIPGALVEQVRQVKAPELARLYNDRRIEWQGGIYPFHYLPHLLGDAARMPESLPHNAVLLLRSGEQRLALHVDELEGSHEAVVKDAGPQLARLAWVAGATLLGSGAVALVLNPPRLVQRSGMAAGKAVTEVLRSRPLVMVVDDSLTVRNVTTHLLQRAGYQVATAKDGVDALEQLAELSPAVMLLDIEMPRMDGFELTRQLRREPATQNLPIIMITSRDAGKHRDHALQLGANAYLGKPYQDEELLQRIAGFAPLPELG